MFEICVFVGSDRAHGGGEAGESAAGEKVRFCRSPRLLVPAASRKFDQRDEICQLVNFRGDLIIFDTFFKKFYFL